jgi:gamma-glutamyltranspeptidase/glutathione hydrolase
MSAVRPRLLCALLLAACGILPARADLPALAPEAPSAIGALQTSSARHFMAVTANPIATSTAAAILRRGGSAVDAAIAAQMVLGLVEPQSSGLGGGAFMLSWDQRGRHLRNYDGRETAPAAVDERHFLDAGGKPLNFLDAVIGGHAVGVPGVVKMLALAHREQGRLPWAELFQPAIELAERGFAISPRLHTLLRETPRLDVNPAIHAYFFRADGSPKPVGFMLKNPAYANSLRQLAAQGEAAFYRGAIARDIVRAVRHNPNRAGKLALADLTAYRSVERTPVCGSFRQYKVCGAAPPSSGGIAVLQILGMLQHFDDTGWQPDTAPFYHLFAESSRLAFADRDTYVADPDFVPVPIAGLIDPAYLARRARLIDPRHAMATAPAGQPAWPAKAARRDYLRGRSPELICTSHLSIVDADGNAVSMTTSIETAFGSRLLVDGFLLNNQLTDFSFVPATVDGQRIANRIEPGKRPRSSMVPIIVFENEQPVLLLGSPGGARIIDYVAKTLAYALENKMSLADAIASPHVVAMNRGLELEEGRVGEGVRKQLQALGHDITEAPETSGLGGIQKTGGTLNGSADPRREGTAEGG